MKKMMIITVGAITFGAIAQEMELPPPPVPAPSASVTVEIAVPPPPPAPVIAPVVDELDAGALCKVYSITFKRRGSNVRIEDVEDALLTAVPVAQEYDSVSTKFDGKKVAKQHDYNVVVWNGVFDAKVSGRYVFTVDAYCAYGIRINGVGINGTRQNNFEVELKKGANAFVLYRYISNNTTRRVKKVGGESFVYTFDDFGIDYRLSTSTQPANNLTPNMLKHIVKEEPEPDWTID